MNMVELDRKKVLF
jgi:hypothetical protein